MIRYTWLRFGPLVAISVVIFFSSCNSTETDAFQAENLKLKNRVEQLTREVVEATVREKRDHSPR